MLLSDEQWFEVSGYWTFGLTFRSWLVIKSLLCKLQNVYVWRFWGLKGKFVSFSFQASEAEDEGGDAGGWPVPRPAGWRTQCVHQRALTALPTPVKIIVNEKHQHQVACWTHWDVCSLRCHLCITWHKFTIRRRYLDIAKHVGQISLARPDGQQEKS